MARQKVETSDSVDAGKLKRLLDTATRGPWRIDRGLMGDRLRITAYEREPMGRDEGDGPICDVSTERHHYSHDQDIFGNVKGETRSWKTPIKKARADAELIVAAVNALPELMRRAKLDIEETAWLIEWPADRFGPVRYWSAGDPMPVIAADEATRFSRQKDAESVIRAQHLSGQPKAVEHMWITPKKKAA